MIASLPSMSSSLPRYTASSSSSSHYPKSSSTNDEQMTRPLPGTYRPSWPPALPSMNGGRSVVTAAAARGGGSLSSSSSYYHDDRQRYERQSSSPTPSNQSGSSGSEENSSLHARNASAPNGSINTQDAKSGALTAAGTGRKRKRLQRVSRQEGDAWGTALYSDFSLSSSSSTTTPLSLQACVPCHKAKRRCDGGLPCSNCDFSGRSCSYSDSQGNAVQPTARARPTSTSVQQHQQPQQEGDGRHANGYPAHAHVGELQASYYTHSSQSPDYASHHDRFQRPKIAPSYPLGVAASGLPNSSSMPAMSNGGHYGIHSGHDQVYDQMRVFQTCAPFNAILPDMFFTHQARPSHILSIAIGSIVASSAPVHDEYTSSVVKLLVEGDHHTGRSHFEHSSTERALALVLLAVHDLSRGRTMGALTLSTAALRMVQDLGLHEGAVVPGDVFHPIHCARLVCLVYTVEVLVAAIACKPSCLGELDFAVASSTVSHLTTKGEHRGDRITAAYLALLGSAQVFLDVVQHQRRLALHMPAVETDKSKYRCQDALNAWATTLPSTLTFNDGNLTEASRSNTSDGGNDRAWGWAWCMMHCFAEMSVCMLENDAAPGYGPHQRHPSNGSVGRRSAAGKNLGVLLDVVRVDARRSIFSLLPLLFAAQSSVEPSMRVSSYLSALRENVALTDDRLRKTMVYLGTNGTVGSHPMPTSTTSPRMRSSSFISRAAPPPPFSPLPLPTPPASDGMPPKTLGSPSRHSPLPALKIGSPPSVRQSLKLPSLSPTSGSSGERGERDHQQRLLPSITTSSPPASQPYLKSPNSTAVRDGDRTLPPLTNMSGNRAKSSSISNTLSPVAPFGRAL